MHKIKYRPFFIIGLFAFIITAFFNNCSPHHEFQFREEPKEKIQDSLISQAGIGEGYFGKPHEGEYKRSFPTYLCAGKPTDLGKLNVTKTSVEIVEDSCSAKDIDFSFTDTVLEYSSYNSEYLGVGSAIYRRANSDGKLPLTEAWCRLEDGTTGIDVVVTTDDEQSFKKGNVYVGYNLGSGQQTNQKSGEFDVAKFTAEGKIHYQSKSLDLQLAKPLREQDFSSGHIKILLDNVIYEKDVQCRVLSKAPIEEMHIGITSIYPLNSFTTDLQEQACLATSVYTCENFEDRVVKDFNDLARSKFKNSGGVVAYANSLFGVVMGESFDGSKAFEFFYPSGATTGWGTLGFGILQPTTKTLYVRYYAKWSGNFVWSPTQTDLFYIWPMDNASPISFVIDGKGKLGFLPANNTGIPISTQESLSLNQWHCIEYGVNYNSASTTSDGTVEMWVDGRKVMDFKNQNVTSNIRPAPAEISFGSDWYCQGEIANGKCNDSSNPANNHPAQSVWYDNLVVSKQRIGCF